MRVRAMMGLLLGAVLLVSGCAQSRDTSNAASGDSGSTAAAFAFTAKALDGSAFDGRSLAGKPTVFWFWAPWCPTCRAQAGSVTTIATDYAGRVNVVGVGGLSEAADIREFARAVDGPTHLVDVEGAVWTHFGVTAQSTFVLLDARGAVVVQGYLDNAELSARVADLVS